MEPEPETCEVVVLGAGVGGMTAAYELRARDVVVLERRNRVGGRTLSGGDDAVWFNVGAQLMSSERLMALARELGLDLVSLEAADFGFVVNGKFARGRSSEQLFFKLNLPWLRKVDFGITALRLQRKLRAVESMTADQRASLDRQSLLDTIGRVSPTTAQMLSDCCENAVGIPASGASGLYGLAYGLGAFLDPGSKNRLRSVRGGNQRVSLAMADRLPPDAMRLGCEVTSVRQQGDRVVVAYQDAEGALKALCAKHCISALPAAAVLTTVAGLPGDKLEALRHITPYSSLISIAWPVADGTRAPWDGVFVCPVTGRQGFNLLTNYGFLTKQTRPELGGYINTLSAGAKADLFEAVDDDAMLDRLYGEIVAIWPEARTIVDRSGAVAQRWIRGGLPPMRPGYLADRDLLRQACGNIHFCGDYTSEPGLPGAHNSGLYAARAVARQLEATRAAATPAWRSP